jgi:hypothetical protein
VTSSAAAAPACDSRGHGNEDKSAEHGEKDETELARACGQGQNLLGG